MERAGGTCLNHGCKPTKALRASATVAHQARRAAVYGVHTGEVASTSAPRSAGCAPSSARCRSRWTTGSPAWTAWTTSRARPGCGPTPNGQRHEVTVNGEVLTAPEVYLNVGGRASRPPIAGLDSGRGDDRGRAAGPRRAAGPPGRRRRWLHRLRVRPDVPPLRLRGHHDRRQRASPPARTTTCSRSSPTPSAEEGITIRHRAPDPGRPARRRGRGHGGRRQHRDRQPPAAGHRPALQLRPARRPRHPDRRARLLRDRRPVPDLGPRRLGPRAT